MTIRAWGLLLVAVLLAGVYGARERARGDGPVVGGLGDRAEAMVVAAAGRTRVTDRAGILSEGGRWRMTTYLKRIADETTIDIRLLFDSPPANRSLEAFAAEEATRRGIGRENGLRGILIVYDPVAERMRLELGYGLEPYFPDAFVGELLERQVPWYFRGGDPERMHLMLRILHWRIRDHMLGGRFDPEDGAWRNDAAYVSGGGGASARVPVPAPALEPIGTMAGFRTPLPAAVRRRFEPGPTPELTFRRYLHWLELGRLDPDVGIFTPSSRGILTHPAMTPPYLEFIRWNLAGHRYRIVARGERALIVLTSTPLQSPLFLVRGEDGWRMDILSELNCSQEFAGGPITWSLRPDCDAMASFQDLVVVVDGVYHRVRGGDNRRLPIP
jgi:hypothetical protein